MALARPSGSAASETFRGNRLMAAGEAPLRVLTASRRDACVGKQSHWCCLVTADGEVALNAPVANREHDLDELLGGMPEGTLVVVDQVRNICSLVLKRAELAGLLPLFA